MYSNNILNFQESTTILNAYTKKVWKLIEESGNLYKNQKERIQMGKSHELHLFFFFNESYNSSGTEYYTNAVKFLGVAHAKDHRYWYSFKKEAAQYVYLAFLMLLMKRCHNFVLWSKFHFKKVKHFPNVY